MKNNPATLAFLAILGGCFLAVSLLTGCSASAESNGIRINTSAGESQDNEDQIHSP